MDHAAAYCATVFPSWTLVGNESRGLRYCNFDLTKSDPFQVHRHSYALIQKMLVGPFSKLSFAHCIVVAPSDH